jgi:hypothetical protein
VDEDEDPVAAVGDLDDKRLYVSYPHAAPLMPLP